MTTLLQKQKIVRRRRAAAAVAGSVEMKVPRQIPLFLVNVFESLSSAFSKAGGFIKTFKRSFLSVAGGTIGTLLLVFLLSSVPVIRSGGGQGGLAFPDTDGVEALLFDYLDPRAGYDETADIQLPAYSVLQSVEPNEYTLKRGDTISELAVKYGVSTGTIIAFNGINDVRRIMAGTTLKIPPYNGIPYTVRAGDNIESIARKHNVGVNAILDANDLDTDVILTGTELFIPGGEMNVIELKKALGELFVWPTPTKWLSSRFGYRLDPFTGKRAFHYGIDVPNKLGTRISAAMAGTVSMAGERAGFGKYIIISHAGGYQTYYAHLDSFSVKRGQYVSQGQKIGEMGNTGRSTGTHLHFGLYQYGRPLDPLSVLH